MYKARETTPGGIVNDCALQAKEQAKGDSNDAMALHVHNETILASTFYICNSARRMRVQVACALQYQIAIKYPNKYTVINTQYQTQQNCRMHANIYTHAGIQLGCC